MIRELDSNKTLSPISAASIWNILFELFQSLVHQPENKIFYLILPPMIIIEM